MQSKIITHRIKEKMNPKTYRHKEMNAQEELARLDALNAFNLYAESSLSRIDELLLDTVTNRKKTPSAHVLAEVKEFDALMTTLNENELFGPYSPGYVMPFRHKLYDLQEKYQTWLTVMSYNEDIAKLYAFCKEIGLPSNPKKREAAKAKIENTNTIHVDGPLAEWFLTQELEKAAERRSKRKQDTEIREQAPTETSFLKNVIGHLKGQKEPKEQ